MAGWDDIIKETRSFDSPYDVVRRNYLKSLSKYTGRNTIIYYSSFLTKSNVQGVDINDNDMTGFMNSVRGLKPELGLDLILHTPGGDPTAAESIVNYLKVKFNSIRVIVPHMAMSAGTLISFAANEIILGKHSSLGPIDPQINGISGLDIISEYETAIREIDENQNKIVFWSHRLNSYPPGYINYVQNAIQLSEKLAKNWLKDGMFKDQNCDDLIDNIVSNFNENKHSKNHARHFDINYCVDKGLKITQLEENQEFQDKVLSVHHATMITLSESNNIKIIENQNGIAWINTSVQK